MKKFLSLCCLTLVPMASSLAQSQQPEAPQLPSWSLGPFLRPEGVNPVIKPNPTSIFADPVSLTPLKWEALHTFNPAAVVRNGKVYVLYRAEDDSGDMAI